MAIPFLNNITLNNNEIQNVRLQNAGSPPLNSGPGQIYFNSTNNVARYYNGTAWVDIPRQISVGGTSLAESQAIDLVAGANVGIAESSGTITISSTDQFQGTVTNVSASTAGDALDVVVSNATTAPDLAFTWAGNATQYIDGAGDLTTFPTIPTVPSNIVETIITTNGDFIDLTPTTAASGDVTITADLSATGTPDATVYLRGDNAWEPISAIPGTYTWTVSDGTNSTAVASGETVTFSGTANEIEVAESGRTVAIGLPNDVTIANNLTVGGTGNFTGQVTIPILPAAQTDAASKDYVDNAVVGGLVYQGGYNATLNTPDLDSGTSIAVSKGWTYTVTVQGLFFNELVRVGDVLISEVDQAAGASALANWTTVQNNIDLATDSQVGIGNVNIDGAGDKDGLSLAYASGTATVGLDINGLPSFSINPISDADLAGLEIPLYNGDTSDANEKIEVATLLSAASKAISYAKTITDTDTNIQHGLNTSDVMVQLYDVATGETVYADVDRTSASVISVTFAATPTNSVRVLVQKIG